MKTKITDFKFHLISTGRYAITYKSPVTGKTWMNHTTSMLLIDATKNSDSPKQSDLDYLKRLCKNKIIRP